MFQVETYRKPTFALTVTTGATEAKDGDTLGVDLGAVYHFGAPVKGRPAEYVVTAEPTVHSIPRYEEFITTDLVSATEEEEESFEPLAKGKLDLDDSGKGRFQFQAAPGRKPRTRTLTLEATVTDVDERTVSQRAAVTVHPASYYLGLKVDRYVVQAGTPTRFQYLAATPAGEVLAGKNAKFQLYRRVWQTVRRKAVGGYYEYVSTPQDTLVQEQEGATGSSPADLTLTLPQGGYYFLKAAAQDEAGRQVATAVDVYAYGAGAAGWEHYDHDRIDLIPDKQAYQPGETAKILVKSPFVEGTGLLTVEQSGVRRSRLFTLDSASPVLEVKIEPGDAPNLFVSALLVRGRIAEKLDERGQDVGKPAFKVGYTELTVKDDSRKLKIDVTTTAPQAKPGQEVDVTVKVTDQAGQPVQAELALAVADAALLQLASENGYYPEKLFFAPSPLAVWTADTRLNLIGRRTYGLKGASPGGGGMEEGGERFRREFVSLALWAPHLTTDANGQAQVKFKLPDNLTTFKIFAVGSTETDRFGTGTASIVVAKPLLMKPALPAFSGVGDEYSANVAVHNLTDQTGQVEVTLAGEGFQVVGPAAQSIPLAGRESKEVGFKVKALAGSQAVFRFTLAMGNEKDAAEFTIPTRYPNPLITVGTYGRMTESVGQAIKLPANADPDRGHLTVTLSPSLAGSFLGAVDYLAVYPHACMEQKTSRAWGDLTRVAWRTRLGGQEKDEQAARARLASFVDALENTQRYDGGFTFWPGEKQADPYLSAYVVQFLYHARKIKAAEVPEGMLRRSQDYLFTVLKQNQWPYWYGNDERRAASAFLTMVLAETGESVDAQIEALYQVRDQLGTPELALLLYAVSAGEKTPYAGEQTKDLTNRLFGRAVIASGEVHFEEKNSLTSLMGSRTRTNAYALRAMLKSAPNGPHVTPLARWLAASRQEGHWGGTQANAAALLAMGEYLEALEKDQPDCRIQAQIDGRNILEGVFKSYNDPAVSAQAPTQGLTPGQKSSLKLDYQGQGAAYYHLAMMYAAKEPDLKPYQAGLILDRTYAKAGEPEGKTSTRFQRGDLVKVTVTLLAPSQRHWVVLQDWLPAGLEPINFNLAAAPMHLQNLLDSESRPEEWYRQYWYQHQEIGSDHVSVYARVVPEGVYTFSYLTRAVTPGTFIAPGSTAEEMYQPETSGRSEGTRIEIR
jgi:uncharacterized protein YfaS (alpha-2-macroglobulin family)